MDGGVAQMVERSLSMREVPGSIPGASKPFLSYFITLFIEFNVFETMAKLFYLNLKGLL